MVLILAKFVCAALILYFDRGYRNDLQRHPNWQILKLGFRLASVPRTSLIIFLDTKINKSAALVSTQRDGNEVKITLVFLD